MAVEPFRIERFMAAHEFTTPHLLGVSDCESRTVGELLAMEPGAESRLEAMTLGYTETQGDPRLREAIASHYQGVGADQVLVHNAAVEVLLTVSLALLEPGDHAVVHHPGYQAQRSGPDIAGARVSRWWARSEAGWRPDLEVLPSLLDQPRTRLLVVTTPHNPTGFHFTEDELRSVIRMAEERGVIVLVDEAYRGTEYEPADRLPSAVELSDTAGALGLVSKGLGLPGLRLGWLVSRNPRLLAAVTAAKDFTSICSSGPSELLAEIGVRHADHLLEQSRRRLVEHLGLLSRVMEEHRERFRWVRPRAGPVTFPTLRSEDPDAFAARARTEAGVLVVPGTVFDEASKEIRIGFGRDRFPEALEAFDRWLRSAGGGPA